MTFSIRDIVSALARTRMLSCRIVTGHGRSSNYRTCSESPPPFALNRFMDICGKGAKIAASLDHRFELSALVDLVVDSCRARANLYLGDAKSPKKKDFEFVKLTCNIESYL